MVKSKKPRKKATPTAIQRLRKEWRAKLVERKKAVRHAERELKSLGIKHKTK